MPISSQSFVPLRPTRRDLFSQGTLAALGAYTGVPLSTLDTQMAGIHRSDVNCRTITADGVEIFYRYAGPVDAPVLLLLHGFPNSSHYFRELMPRLADKFLMIAPDFPSFGFTVVPDNRNYKYSFASFTQTLGAFIDALALKKYAMYLFDYGAPIGLRHALTHPERVTGIISQNGNAYDEGLGERFWGPVRAYWKEQTSQHREALRSRLTFAGVRDAYLNGAPNPLSVAPEAYWLDATLMARPGNIDIQLDLKLDYESNVAIYSKFQAYFRKMKPPTLAIWGKYDPAFIPPGAEAFRRDLPEATIKLLDAGHFALETEVDSIASAIRDFAPKIAG